MTKKYRLVVFDWEGTLAEDELSLILKIMRDHSTRLQLGPIDAKRFGQLIHQGLLHAIHYLFPKAPLQQQEELLHAIQNAMTQSSSRGHLINGALALIHDLQSKGVGLAVATNKSQQGLDAALMKTGLQDIFKVTRTLSQAPPKPCPQMLAEIIDIFAVTPEQTLMIGDTLNDVEMAAALGVDALALDVFQLQEDILKNAGALAVFDSYQTLQAFLKERL